MPPTLVLVRHATAESAAPTDHARLLAERGRVEARATGEWLATQALGTPGRVLVSDAERARSTWEELALAAGWPLEAEYDAAVYAADPDTVIDLVAQTPADVDLVLVVGHNPTMASLVPLLDAGAGEVATQVLTRGFPPASAAVLDVPGAWRDLAMGSATVTGFRPGAQE